MEKKTEETERRELLLKILEEVQLLNKLIRKNSKTVKLTAMEELEEYVRLHPLSEHLKEILSSEE